MKLKPLNFTPSPELDRIVLKAARENLRRRRRQIFFRRIALPATAAAACAAAGIFCFHSPYSGNAVSDPASAVSIAAEERIQTLWLTSDIDEKISDFDALLEELEYNHEQMALAALQY